MALENAVRDLLVESKNKTNERYDEYLIRDKYDLIDIIEVYLKVKFRDNISLEASNVSMRTMLKRYFDQACSKVMINKDSMIKYLSSIHSKNKNSLNHYEIMTNEIDNIIADLRRNNPSIEPKETSDVYNNTKLSSIYSELHEAVSHELMRRGIFENWSNVNLYKDSLITSWKDGMPDEAIPCRETYLVSDEVGNREENIGAYYGLTEDYEYIFIPQGIGYLNRITGSYNKTNSYTCNNLNVFVDKLVNTIQQFYHIKYNK